MEKQQKTTFSFSNMTERNSSKALWAFGFAEGIIAIIQSAEWVREYEWWVRILPIAAFSISQFKLLFKTETVGGTEVARIVSESGADVNIMGKQEEKPEKEKDPKPEKPKEEKPEKPDTETQDDEGPTPPPRPPGG